MAWIDDLLNTDNFGNAVRLSPSSVNYFSDTGAPDGSDGLSDAIDGIFKYAKQGAGFAQSLGIIPSPTPTQAVANPQQKAIQPTGLNPVVQTPQSTEAPNFIDQVAIRFGFKPSTTTRIAVGVGVLAGGILAWKFGSKLVR